MFSLHPESGVPLYRQLMEQIRRLIAGGQLPPGTALPSVRELALEHAVNPMTISKAYALLEAEGLLERNRGKPMTVAAGAPGAAPLARRLQQLEPQVMQLAAAAKQLELSFRDAAALLKRQWEQDDDDQVAVSTSGLGKRIEGRAVLEDITVQLPRGQVVGLVGKNGAGKSTLFDLLLGFSLPGSGSSSIFGEDSRSLTASAKARIGFVPQQDELLGQLTGAHQLALIATLHRRWNQALIDRLAREWELPLTRRIGKLSGGERQKLSTLCALGHEPDLLVLDEPASSLDPVARRRFMQEILAIAAQGGRTLVYASHIVADLERVASHLWLLREGRLMWQGELDALKESVVRVHLRGASDIDPALKLPGQLQGSVQGRTAAFTVGGWSAARLLPLRDELGLDVEVEPLGLEDIFLAMHA